MPSVPPDSIAGLLAWHRADSNTFEDSGGTNPCEDNDAVVHWKTAGGPSVNITSSGGTSPNLRNATLNGEPTVEFEGDTAIDRLGRATGFQAPAEITVAAVFQVDTTEPQNSSVVTLVNSDGSVYRQFMVRRVTSHEVAYDDTNNSAILGDEVIATGSYYAVIWRVSTAEVEFFVNGVAQGGGALGAAPPETGVVGLYLGDAPNIGDGFEAHLADVSIFDNVISDADRNGLFNYFYERYGVGVEIPDGQIFLETGGVLAASGSMTITGTAAFTSGGRLGAIGDSVVPEGPILSATVVNYRRITVTHVEGGEGAVSYELHRSTSSGFTPGAPTLLASGLADGFSYADEGLADGDTYYYVGVAINGDARGSGPELEATTNPQVVFTGSFTGFTEANVFAQFSHGEDEIAVEIQYQTTLDTDPTFATPYNDVVLIGANRYLYAVDDLVASTDYLTRARTRLSSSDPWEPWSDTVAWTSHNGVLQVLDGIRFVRPYHGEPVRGTEVVLEWLPAGAGILDVEISDDMGATWTSVPFTQYAATFDSTGFTDGPYIARGTVDGACSVFYHSGFFIDNAEAVHYEDDFFETPRPEIAKYWSPTVPRWLLTSGLFKPGTGHIGPAPMATFGPINPPELTSTLGVCFMAECAAIGNGVGFSWDRCQAGELLDLGIVVLGAGEYPGGVPVGVRCGIKHHFLSSAYQTSIPDEDNKFRFVGVAEASSHTRFELGVGTASVQPGGGWHTFSEPCTAGMSWTKMSDNRGNKSGATLRPYRFVLWVTRPDPILFPNRLFIRARIGAPDAWSCNGERHILIEETVDVERPNDGGGTDPYVFEPGHLAFLSDKMPGNRAGDSARWVMRWSAMFFEEPAVPYEPEPDVPLFVARACDLVLEVFDDDRETIKWSAGSTRSHATPYLVEPDSYAEQEIDVASGGATIGTVTVTVIDPTTEVGNQDAGWMTAKLAELGLADLHGRRARLNRYVNAPEGTVPMVIIDGVAGEPSMDPSYAAFKFTIRDTRETERKVRITETENPGTLLPLGVLDGYGWDPVSATYLIDPTTPLLGKFQHDASNFDPATTGWVNLVADPGNAAALRTIPKAIYDAMAGTAVMGAAAPDEPWADLHYRTTFKGLSVRWRDQGSSDPWTEVGETLVIDGTSSYLGAEALTNIAFPFPFATGEREILRVFFGDSAATPQMPANNQDIELIVVSRKPASPDTPLYVEGLTAGEFTKNVYDGLYSPRDENDEIVPSGIKYDPAAVLAMTEPVRLRIMAPIADARTYLEKVIYAATGRSPALDQAGRISPVSQIAPTDFSDLDVVNNEVTEPAPDWGSGTRIINVVRFTYQRDYVPDDPDEAETADGLVDRDVLVEFRDEPSIARHGEQLLEIDGAAFRAIGNEEGDPLSGAQSDEEGFIMANLRRLHVLNRYSLGAPSMQVNVKRAPLIEMRAGDFVRVLLSWMPDYITGQRGLVALCQVMAIADLNCAWRRVTLEVVLPIEGSS